MTVLSRAMALVFGLGLFAVLVTSAKLAVASSHASETKGTTSVSLVMIEEPGCGYCERWHEEVGTAYPKTNEGRFAPLTTYFDYEPEAERFNAAYSPTFIVVKGSHEVGRILGYPGEDFFWLMLHEILAKTGYTPDKLAVGRKAR